MDKIAGILLITLLAIVAAVSLSYYALNQPNQTSNNPSPTTSPTPSPSETPTDSASIPKPSIPEFSLKLVAYPYDVAPTTTTDPYTGKTSTTSSGYHAENKSIEVTIKNQPFPSTQDASGNYANLYYFIRFKGNYADEWKYYPHDPDSNYSTATATPFNASQSEFTIISVGLATYLLNNVPVGGQIDFQVEAFIGYANRETFFFLGGEGYYYTFSAFERSGWSNTQTITISPIPSEEPTELAFIPAPSVPEFTVELVDTSYDVPTTYSTDPYTGETITHEGYHVARRTIEVKIKNQPFTPFTDSNGREIKFYYNIRIKGHYEEWGSEFDVVYNLGEMPTQSNSEYTVISYNSEGTYSFNLAPVSRMLEVSPNGKVDFQVKALVGSAVEGSIAAGFPSVFTGKESDWSATQTITIP